MVKILLLEQFLHFKILIFPAICSTTEGKRNLPEIQENSNLTKRDDACKYSIRCDH